MVLGIPGPIRNRACGGSPTTAAPVTPTPDRVKFARPSTQPVPDPRAPDPDSPDPVPPDPGAADQPAEGAGIEHAGPEVDTAA